MAEKRRTETAVICILRFGFELDFRFEPEVGLGDCIGFGLEVQ